MAGTYFGRSALQRYASVRLPIHHDGPYSLVPCPVGHFDSGMSIWSDLESIGARGIANARDTLIVDHCRHFLHVSSCSQNSHLLRFSPQAFVPRLTFMPASPTALDSCRTNAKKEKIKRNRDNMRKFKTGGRRGLSRRKILKKAQSAKARQEESEFIARCFITAPAPNADEKN